MKDKTVAGTLSETLANLIRLEESHPFPTSLGSMPPLEPVDAKLAVAPSDNGHLVRSSARSLAALRSLSPEALIILFTPVLRPPQFNREARKARDPIDPFEDLGRAINEYHQRVRHVPYVPKAGMSSTHVAFLRHASAVIVVCCSPVTEDKTAKHLCIYNQGRFAAQLEASTKRMRIDADRIPHCLIAVGMNVENKLTMFENVVAPATADTADFEQTAALLFSSAS